MFFLVFTLTYLILGWRQCLNRQDNSLCASSSKSSLAREAQSCQCCHTLQKLSKIHEKEEKESSSETNWQKHYHEEWSLGYVSKEIPQGPSRSYCLCKHLSKHLSVFKLVCIFLLNGCQLLVCFTVIHNRWKNYFSAFTGHLNDLHYCHTSLLVVVLLHFSGSLNT